MVWWSSDGAVGLTATYGCFA